LTNFFWRNNTLGICLCGGGCGMNFIEELYYGNINPNEKRYKKATPYDKALSIFTANEEKLKEALSGEHLKLFNELVNASDEISATSGVEISRLALDLVLRWCATF